MSTIHPWRPWVYAAGSVVNCDGQLWQAKRVTFAHDIPGTSDAWAVYTVKDMVSQVDMARAVDPRIGSGI